MATAIEGAPTESGLLIPRHAARTTLPSPSTERRLPSSGTHDGQCCAQVRGMMMMWMASSNMPNHSRNTITMPIQSKNRRVACCVIGTLRSERRTPEAAARGCPAESAGSALVGSGDGGATEGCDMMALSH